MNLRTSFSAIAALLFITLGSGPLHASQLVKLMHQDEETLNTTYQRVLKRMPNDASREKLKAAQRAWIAWRDAEIALEVALYGEFDGKTDVYKQIDLTEARIHVLEDIEREVREAAKMRSNR